MRSAVIRLDASSEIGSGHAVRCATLAHTLRQRGLNCTIICRILPGDATTWLKAQGFAVHQLPTANGPVSQEQDAKETLISLTDVGEIAWLIVDHYALDACWETIMRPRVENLLVIDDLANRQHRCDILLDQNLRQNGESDYEGLTEGINSRPTRHLLGPKYALLRPEFSKLRTELGDTQQQDHKTQVKRILICFGGSDPANYTTKTLSTLIALAQSTARIEQIDIVIGAANQHRTDIESFIKSIRTAQLPAIKLHVQTDRIAELLAIADLAIGAGGTMNWERACLGVPTLAFAIVENQIDGLNQLIEHGYLLGSTELHKPELIAPWIACAISNPALLHGLRHRSRMLTDGRGAERVADEIAAIDEKSGTPIFFRPATEEDCEPILAWRNADEIRKISLQKDTIDPSTHRTWFAASLKNPARLLLIAETGAEDTCPKRPVGVVRFDLEKAEATISIFRTPDAPPRCNLVRCASAWLRTNHPEITRIKATILAENTASMSAFLSAGYRPAHSTLKIEFPQNPKPSGTQLERS